MTGAQALLLWALAAPVAAGAEDVSGYYQGAIEAGRRKLEVGLELVVEGSAVSGSCFYIGAKGADIPVEGAVQADGALRFDEKDARGGTTGIWSGRRAGDTLSGTWQNPKTGQRWPFTLTAREARGRSVGEAVRVNAAGGRGPLTWRMTEAPVTGKVVPQVTQFADRGVMNAVNRHLMAAARGATCGAAPDEYELAAAVAYAGEDVFSVRLRASWFCGGPYPTTDADLSATFDLRTGAVVDLASLFQGATPQALGEVFYAYELAQVRPRLGQEPVSEDDPDACLFRYTPQNLAQSQSSFHFSAEGLVVRPEWAHVFAGCAHEVTVPYRALAGLAAPGGALARVAAAHAEAPLRYRIRPAGARPDQEIVYTPPR